MLSKWKAFLSLSSTIHSRGMASSMHLWATVWAAVGVSVVAAISASSASSFSQTRFDFVIVGGGNSGLVLAARLSENPSVLVGVLEAGKYYPNNPVIEIPQSFASVKNPNGIELLGNPEYDWKFSSVPQPGLNGTIIRYPRGKAVGGSTILNSMIWQRGAKEEYDAWATSIGNGRNWSYNALLPYFKRTEQWRAPSISIVNTTESSLTRGSSGPVNVTYNTFLTDLDKPAAQAAISIGLPANANPDEGYPLGISNIARNVDAIKAIRRHAGNTYYGPVSNRPNLILLTEAHATSILYDVKQSSESLVARGVSYIHGSSTFEVSATKEVILAAGSLKTPQILELSGIGNKTILDRLGIETLVDLPSVGENLQDHPIIVSDFMVKEGVITIDWLQHNATYKALQQITHEKNATGALTYTPGVMGPATLQTFIPSARLSALVTGLDASLPRGLQITPLQAAQYSAQKSFISSRRTPAIELVLVPYGGVASVPQSNKSYVTLCSMLVHPFSRGSVHINQTDGLANPVIDPKFFHIAFDKQVAILASQFLRKWASQPPLSDFISEPLTPPLSTHSDEDWEKFVNQYTGSTNHPIGTTAMAPRNIGGVVDTDLKVYGHKNVRIVDAGVIPLTIGVPIQPTVYAIAEKISDVIKHEYKI